MNANTNFTFITDVPLLTSSLIRRHKQVGRTRGRYRALPGHNRRLCSLSPWTTACAIYWIHVNMRIEET